jgi:cation transport regulator ChaC
MVWKTLFFFVSQIFSFRFVGKKNETEKFRNETKRKTNVFQTLVSWVKGQTDNNLEKIENLQKLLQCLKIKKKTLNHLQKKCLIMRIGGKMH